MLDAHFWGAVVTAVALLIAFLQLLRLVQLRMLHTTLRDALKAGVPISVEQLDRALGRRPVEERRMVDRRNGLILIALAFAAAGFGLLQGDTVQLRFAAGLALFPLFAGAMLVVTTLDGRRSS